VLLLQLVVALLFLGILSIYSPFQQLQLAVLGAETADISWTWKIIFAATEFIAVLQRFLFIIFISMALPVAKRWVSEMKAATKSLLMELLPWKIFLFLHYSILHEKRLPLLEDSVYALVIAFRFFSLLWLLFLTMYVGYDFAIPCKYESRRHGRKELAGVYKSNFNYPPKSQVVTGLSPRHYALRYKRISSNGEDEKEMKARIRTNAMVHEQYRILLSQLD
jgi:hypothetical protein